MNPIDGWICPDWIKRSFFRKVITDSFSENTESSASVNSGQMALTDFRNILISSVMALMVFFSLAHCVFWLVAGGLFSTAVQRENRIPTLRKICDPKQRFLQAAKTWLFR
ncbi:MAG TPA: hypothetical protein PKE03_11015 [Bacteroidales bacterium]|nr:hypothetical protein [Bacteroidales bacterium]